MPVQPWGFFRPDAAETNAGVSANILNAIIRKDELGVSYGPDHGISVPASAVAISAPPKGGISVVDRAGIYFAFIGTDTTIEQLTVTYTFNTVGTGYSLTSGDRWSAIGFGNFALFTNTTDGLQQYDVEAGGTFTAVPNTYSPRIIFLAFDCLFGGDCLDSNGIRDNRLLRNSAINDHTNFEDKGAGYQVMPDGEEIIGGAQLSNSIAVVFQRNAVRRLTRTIDGSIYTMDDFAIGVGATNPSCIVAINGVAYFIDTDGIKAVSAGSGVVNIGEGKVDEWFLGMVAAGGLASIEAAVDPAMQRVRWRYQAASNVSTTTFSDTLDYYINIGEFVPGNVATQAIITLATPGYDMDSMDSLYPSMDDPTMPDMDSRFWAGGEPGLLGIDENGKAGFFNGATLEATLETGTIMLDQSSLINSVDMVTDSPDALLSLSVRDRLSSPKVYTNESAITASGTSYTRGRGHCISAKARHPAATDWVFNRGIDNIKAKTGGSR